VLGVGRGQHDRPRQYPPLNKPGAVLLWIESGTGRLELGSQTVVLQSGLRCWLYNLRQPRRFTPAPGQPLVVQSIRFSGPDLDAWLDTLGVARKAEFTLTAKWASHIVATQDRLVCLAKARPPHWEWKAHLAFTCLFEPFVIVRNLLNPDQSQLPAAIVRALNAIETDPFRDWRARELARIAGVSYSAFRAQFREHMRAAVHQHLQRSKMELAQRLLSDQRLQIKQIAERLHFSRAAYFSRFFRQLTGMSPTEFREHLGVQS